MIERHCRPLKFAFGKLVETVFVMYMERGGRDKLFLNNYGSITVGKSLAAVIS